MMDIGSYTLVARLRNRELGIIEYMGITPLGTPGWFDSPVEATVYQSRRAANAAAARLPCSNRAFPLSAPTEGTKATVDPQCLR
jgi:hypothetical protein